VVVSARDPQILECVRRIAVWQVADPDSTHA